MGEGEKKIFKCRSCENVWQNCQIKKIPCKTCEKKFDSPSDLKRHTRNDHHEKLNNLHKCEQCEKIFGISKTLERHILAVHADKKEFECKFCEKSFERKISLIQHTKTHTKWNQKRKMSKMNNSSIKKKIQKNLNWRSPQKWILRNINKKLVKSGRSISRKKNDFDKNPYLILLFQKWPKINFWTGKKFKTVEYAISWKIFT